MRAVNPNDGYLEALVKNMPSETVAAYLAIGGLLAGLSGTARTALQWVVWGLFLVATPFYLWLVTRKNTPRPWWQVWIFAPIAFFAWSMTTGGPWQSIKGSALLGAVLMILLSGLIFPLISMAITKSNN
jgi:hypothetical protein